METYEPSDRFYDEPRSLHEPHICEECGEPYHTSKVEGLCPDCICDACEEDLRNCACENDEVA